MTKYRLNSSLKIEHFLDGEDVIFDAKNETAHVLNYAASLILQVRLEYNDAAYSPYHEFRQKVLETFTGVVESELENDFDEAIKMLLEKKILEIYDE